VYAVFLEIYHITNLTTLHQVPLFCFDVKSLRGSHVFIDDDRKLKITEMGEAYDGVRTIPNFMKIGQLVSYNVERGFRG
jgi:hypothetical protein